MSDEEPEINRDTEAMLALQMGRRWAYNKDLYELGDDEGFSCTECDWRGLSAPMNEDWDDASDEIVECPECAGTLDNNGSNWFDVVEKLLAINYSGEIEI